MKNLDQNLGGKQKTATNATHPNEAPKPQDNVIELDNYRPAAASRNAKQQRVAHYDNIAYSISWAAMRSDLPSESRNCKVAKKSTAERLLLTPCFTLQYVAASVAAVIMTCLALLAASSSNLAFWKLNPFINAVANIDPTLKVFIYLFGVTALAFIANLLLKPVRTVEFNKSMGVFWIEKTRVFGWKVGESAQMPLAQAYALQITSHTKRDSQTPQKATIDELNLAELCKAADKQPLIAKYEVNVVFSSGERVNIINHVNNSAIRQDAALVAEFLDVPIWDQEKDEFLPYEEPQAQSA